MQYKPVKRFWSHKVILTITVINQAINPDFQPPLIKNALATRVSNSIKHLCMILFTSRKNSKQWFSPPMSRQFRKPLVQVLSL